MIARWVTSDHGRDHFISYHIIHSRAFAIFSGDNEHIAQKEKLKKKSILPLYRILSLFLKWSIVPMGLSVVPFYLRILKLSIPMNRSCGGTDPRSNCQSLCVWEGKTSFSFGFEWRNRRAGKQKLCFVEWTKLTNEEEWKWKRIHNGKYGVLKSHNFLLNASGTCAILCCDIPIKWINGSMIFGVIKSNECSTRMRQIEEKW